MIKWCSVLSIISMTASLLIGFAGMSAVAGFFFLMGIVFFFITLITFIFD